MNRSVWMLGVFILACFAVAALGGMATSDSVGTWYQTIRKPSWTPPSWLFGPVWTLLYLMMAIAAWLVWKRTGWSSAMAWFGVQLAFNGAWSFLFFGLRNPLAGLIDIVLLWFAIAVTMVLFWRVSPLAGWLFVPYLAWVSFASALNFALWRLNK